MAESSNGSAAPGPSGARSVLRPLLDLLLGALLQVAGRHAGRNAGAFALAVRCRSAAWLHARRAAGHSDLGVAVLVTARSVSVDVSLLRHALTVRTTAREVNSRSTLSPARAARPLARAGKLPAARRAAPRRRRGPRAMPRSGRRWAA